MPHTFAFVCFLPVEGFCVLGIIAYYVEFIIRIDNMPSRSLKNDIDPDVRTGNASTGFYWTIDKNKLFLGFFI